MKIFYHVLRDSPKLFLLTVLVLYLHIGVVYATVYNVNNTADGNGVDQLRGALMEAGSVSGWHVINISAGTYYIDNGEISFGTVINSNITINGAGAGITVINARNNSRGFSINSSNDITNSKVTFNDLSIINCLSTTTLGGGAIAAGGGYGNIYLFNNCAFDNNRAYSNAPAVNGVPPTSGGAIHCVDASLYLTNCTFTNNISYNGLGGAVFFDFKMAISGQNFVILEITDSRFSFNSALANLAGAGGGAIGIDVSGQVEEFSGSIKECVFLQNSTAGKGGAIRVKNSLNSAAFGISYNRFVGNQAGPGFPSSTAFQAEGINIWAVNNWWGCNGGAGECADRGDGAQAFNPHLELKTTISAPSICYGSGNSVQLTAGFISNPGNGAIDPANLGALVGRPVSFSVLTPMGSVSGAQTAIQANGTATATFTSNGTPGIANIYSICDGFGSETVPLTVNLPGTWLGTSSGDWHLPVNWCGGAVPTASTNVVIPAGTTYSPVVATLTDATVNNITIEAGASLSLGDVATLIVKGDFVNNGTYNANAEVAATLFSGSGTQTIPGGDYALLGISGGDKTLTANAKVKLQFIFLDDTKLILGNSTITIAGSAENFNAARYFVTNGTGGVKKNNVGLFGFTFPIGSETSYTPVVLSNTGNGDNFTARVGDGAYTSYINNVPQGSPVSAQAVNKTWYISEDVPGGSNVALTMYWNLGDELSSFSRINCFVSHYKNSSWDLAVAGSASGGNPYSRGRSGITSFSPFVVTNPGSPLPVTLVGFDAAREGSTALLTWSTSAETNSDRFEVERSINGRNWQNIGVVRSNGESKKPIDYHFVDLYPVFLQENLYRLRMVDRDGTFAYSRIRNLSFEGRDNRIAYPNPASDKLHVGDFTQVSSLRITDMSGREVYQTNRIENAGIQVSKLWTGLHLVEISWRDGRKTIQKVVINQ